YPLLCALGKYFLRSCGQQLQVIDVREPLEALVGSLQARLRASKSTIDEQQAATVQSWLLSEKENFLATVPHLSLASQQLIDQPRAAIQAIIAYLDLSPSFEQ